MALNPFNIFSNLLNKAYEERMNGKGYGTSVYNGLLDSGKTALAPALLNAAGGVVDNVGNTVFNNPSSLSANPLQPVSTGLKAAGETSSQLGNVFKGNANPVNQNTVSAYQDYLRQNGYADNVVNGVAQGLNSGNKEISDWINQYNSGAEGQSNPIKIPKTETEIELARNGQFNAPVQVGNAGVDKKTTLVDKLANGLGDFKKGYQENKTTSFAPENLYSDNSKGIMNRAGEGVGTAAKLLEKPATQAIIAGALSAMNGNGIIPAIGDAYKLGTKKANSNMYKEALARNGINVDIGALGNITSSDMNALMTPSYKEADRKLAEAKLNQQILYENALIEKYLNELAEKKRHNQQTEETNKIKANASVIRANNSGKKSGGTTTTKTPKPQEHKDWGNDLSQYYQVITNPNLANRRGEAKARFIQKYGVSPDKYVKL